MVAVDGPPSQAVQNAVKLNTYRIFAVAFMLLIQIWRQPNIIVARIPTMSAFGQKQTPLIGYLLRFQIELRVQIQCREIVSQLTAGVQIVLEIRGVSTVSASIAAQSSQKVS